MAIKPKIVTLTNSSAQILNAIRNDANVNYRNHVPLATEDADSIKAIGAVIMDYTALQNEFINSLINRIARVIVTSKTYENPWAMFKKGYLEMGETVEEVFVNIAKPFQYDPKVAEQKLFAREIPDVRSAFHHLNYQKFYKVTISRAELKQAFLTVDGVVNLANDIINSMYTAANYDEFITMKYLLARHITAGLMNPVTVPAVQSANMKAIISKIKGFSNKITFLSSANNLAGVMNKTDKKDQYLLVNSDFDAEMDVEVLAAAFHMDKAEFMGHVVLVDGFGELDKARLDELFEDDETYYEFSADEMTALNAIPCVLVDRDWFMIFDNLNEGDDVKNPEGLYWNYFYHTWKTFSVSPFANNAVFVPATPSVTSVTVSPASITAEQGQGVSFTAAVVTANFASKAVNWSTNNAKVPIDAAGNINIPVDETIEGGTEVTITAKSAFDESVYGTATLTIGTAETDDVG